LSDRRPADIILCRSVPLSSGLTVDHLQYSGSLHWGRALAPQDLAVSLGSSSPVSLFDSGYNWNETEQ